MKEEFIRDFQSGKILGSLRTDPNGDVTAVNFNTGMILGYYRAKQNVTTDFSGKILTTGNTVSALIIQSCH